MSQWLLDYMQNEYIEIPSIAVSHKRTTYLIKVGVSPLESSFTSIAALVKLSPLLSAKQNALLSIQA